MTKHLADENRYEAQAGDARLHPEAALRLNYTLASLYRSYCAAGLR